MKNMNITRKIQIGNTIYLVKSVFAKSGPTVTECIESMVNRKINTKIINGDSMMNGVMK